MEFEYVSKPVTKRVKQMFETDLQLDCKVC